MGRELAQENPAGSLRLSAKLLIKPFSETLAEHGLDLKRAETTTLQINVGLLCNQTCLHCHHQAGPNRTELMSRQTVDDVIDYARKGRFQTIDITGGAPEMNPHLCYLVEALAPLTSRLMLRVNLTALGRQNTDELIQVFKANRVVIIASLPSVNSSQTDSQRGNGVFDISVTILKRLNDFGYGNDGEGLELDLVSNPPGAFLPASQSQAEKKFRSDLQRKWGISFNSLFTFANMPLGRFLVWLERSGNLDAYLGRLVASFNPCTIKNLMCRTLVSVSWDGYLYDCDFNQALKVPLGGRKRHVSEMDGVPEPGIPIPIGNHCYACSAGSGVT